MPPVPPFPQADVLEEEPILQWYEKDHSQKGKNVFIKEMKPFVDWIAEAEEEDEHEATAAPAPEPEPVAASG